MVGAEPGSVVPPRLTVAIAAAGSPQPLLATLASLAADAEEPCDILVVDDGLDDASALAGATRADPRIRIRRHERPVGQVASLQEAAAGATTPLVMMLHPGEVVLPGALRAMAEAMQDAPRVGVAHAWWFRADPLGISRPELRRHRRRMAERLPAHLDHRRALVTQGNIVRGLPTFRRDVLAAVGGLRGVVLGDAVYEAVLRLLESAEARLVPRVLCGRPRDCERGHGGGLRRYLGDLARCARLVRRGEAAYLRTPPYRFARLAALGIVGALTRSLPRAPVDRARSWLQRAVHAWRSTSLYARMAHGPGAYDRLVSLLGRWSFSSLGARRGEPRPAGGERIAYLLWRYPTLSETFVRREVQALRDAGLTLEVFALEAPSPALPDDPECPAGPVLYVGAPDPARGRAAAWTWFGRKPWTVVVLWLFVVRHRYRAGKTWWHDRDVLHLAARLAVMMAERGTTHVHSPWANHSALLALLASRLLGVTYSVQARASEIHRSTQGRLISDRVRFAEFLVTNSRYNERYLRSILGEPADLPLHVIYNGVRLDRFRSAPSPTGPGSARLLSVGRLVEAKGFRYLLEACRRLRDRGVEHTCEIIGGPQDPDETVTWVELRKLHAELGLEETVRFRGAMPFSGVLAALGGADIVVLPSVRSADGSHDVTPNILIEAMAMGIPVVSTTIGAIPEIVDHGVDGLLVPPNDAEALAAALGRLLGDADLRRRLGGAARRKVEERFDIERNLAQRARLFWQPQP